MITCHIDTPEPQSSLFAGQLRVEGWIHVGDRQAELDSVTLSVDKKTIAETKVFFSRKDVNTALSLPTDSLTGFRMLAGVFETPMKPKTTLEIYAHLKDGTIEKASSVTVQAINVDVPSRDYGVIFSPNATHVYHRNNIYATGPSSPSASPEAVALIEQYTAPQESVLDIGCGVGAYGRILREKGYPWFGVEVKESDSVELQKLGLPHLLVDGSTLPFEDKAYVNSICIEVLEHIPNCDQFLKEVSRVNLHTIA